VGDNRFSGAASGFCGLESQGLDTCRGGDPNSASGMGNIETAGGPAHGFHELDE
jgi:hypothetical protein